jgi:gliding motility-associated-like protein
MKKATLALITAALYLQVFSQHMNVKQYDFTYFHKDEKYVSPLLDANSSDSAKKHPEYGITPFNTQCKECMELIDKRTINTRQYIDKKTSKVFYSQQSMFPLHYKKSENDIWRTIDWRLHPTNTAGIYIADNQPVITKCDLNRKTTSVIEHGIEFEFNKNLTFYFYQENVASTKPETGNYSDYTIGEQGLLVKNVWNGIDMQQQFNLGEVKTNYVVNSPIAIPIRSGFLVIEDHFTLPLGTTFEEAANGKHIEGGFYEGDYVLKDSKGDAQILYKRPIYVDSKAFGMHGLYKLVNNGGRDYTLQMYVPVEWLGREDNTYPLFIDPPIQGTYKYGDFQRTPGHQFSNFGFTSAFIGKCSTPTYLSPGIPGPMNVPGRSKLTNAYLDIEYSLTYDNTCGTPPLPPPYCTFSQVLMEVVCDSCKTTTGKLFCNPDVPPYTGTCTTDSFPGHSASPILINTFVPNYLSCYKPQCPDYEISFTLNTQDSICGDTCGYLCARGNIWQMTIQACRVDGTVTQDLTQVCAGQPVTFTAHPNCGVPPYHFVWAYDNVVDTVYGNPTLTIHPQHTLNVTCIILDSCNETAIPAPLSVTVIPSPPADAGPDASVCQAGGVVTIGGNPTTTSGTSVLWTSTDANAQTWIDNGAANNPQVTIPATNPGTYYYVVKASNSSCFRTDTMAVTVVANPIVTIDSSGSTRICTNQSVKLTATPGLASYSWSNGAQGPAITVNQSGSYSVVVSDQHGCKDTSNVIDVTTIAVPEVHVYPDTSIHFGDSVVLYTDINLNSASIDSFNWYPYIDISCTTCSNPLVSPQADQYYGVVVHTGGCTVGDSALIKVILPNNFFIPNAFTPNGDGNNETFYIQAQSGVKVVLFQVFNRLGEKVHEGNYPWDGTYRGKPAPAGVYVYIFKLGVYGNDRGLFRKGSVTLMR